MTDLLDPANGISVYKGASKLLELTVVSGSNQPVNINGAKLWFTVKRSITDMAPLFQKRSTVTGEIDITAPDVGRVQITLLPSDTAALDARTYVFDVWIELASGARYVLIPPSDFKVERAVTSFVS